MKQKYVTHSLTGILTSIFPVKIICTFQFSTFQDFIIFWNSKKGDIAGNILYFLD